MLSCTIRRRRLVQRWPAVPTALKTTARTARSRSALGATTMPLLPPSSSSERPSRAAMSGESALPMAVEPVAETSGSRGILGQLPRAVGAADHDLEQALGRVAEGRRGAPEERLAGERGERRALARLPHDGIAAHERQRGVPAPHGDREVEGA